jgi:hypothetical protein
LLSATLLRLGSLLLLPQPGFLRGARHLRPAPRLALSQRVGQEPSEPGSDVLPVLVLAAAPAGGEAECAGAVDAVGEALTDAGALELVERLRRIDIPLELDARR